MPDTVLLHVGTHKTGTSSLQTFLRDENARSLASAGVCYPPGYLLPALHSDLPLLALRPDFQWPARLRFPETQRPSWQAAAAAHVRAQVTTATAATVVYSHEDLSYVRSDDELDRLHALLDGVAVRVVIVLREPEAFLRSYAAQLEATGFPLSDDPGSFAYVQRGSWLTDYDALVGAYQRHFGSDQVEVLDFDDAVAREGSIIPAFAHLLGLDRGSLPALDRYALNRAGQHLRLSDDQLAEIRRDLAERHPA